LAKTARLRLFDEGAKGQRAEGRAHDPAVHLGVAHHLGWAVVVPATEDYIVVDRRRVELVEKGVSPAPIHNEGGAFPLHRPAEPLDVYDKDVEEEGTRRLGDRAGDVLRGPRTRLGAPWSKDHRAALAATTVAK
jgi:hypothetical protein